MPYGGALAIGVLGFQGDVHEHLQMVERCEARAVEVRTPEALASVQGLILPGGESTTIGRLLARSGLDTAIRARARAGMPVYGTCAGAILLATDVTGGEPPHLALMDIAVDRNAYGRQRESFETLLVAPGIDPAPFRAVFIRAPVIRRAGGGVEVLATHGGAPVLVRQGQLLAATFHPELSGYDGIHRYFHSMVQDAHARGPLTSPTTSFPTAGRCKA